ncbi:tyrosine-type recombinase/integrase [Cytobacillus oceanisediminis]|uniref:tyrosine-type recombinase/integrase n=1 Tax=Cytobacillus oceanisediminis TaxID=665099 RepID=UPI00254F09B9|nr:tyrosine-type recombinase/integrase [Cytobacillus oceanisediminis]MDK7668683.1 tyrosine-type recombinase/integrase [Cytobacillus oceanisediminis]
MLTSEECIRQFVHEYSVKLAKVTLKGYENSIRQMLSICDKSFDEITIHDIRNWLIHLDESGYKSSSIKTKLFGLHLFYQYCREEGYLNYHPVEGIPLPKDEDKLPKYLTYEELAQLRLLSEGNLKIRAVIEVLYTTGVRISELINMKLDDINWEERMVRIPTGKGKKERIVLFTRDCAEHVEAYLKTRSDSLPFVFLDRFGTGPIGYYSVLYWFGMYGEKLDILLTPHVLRHTFAAHMAIKGMPMHFIQAILGHENPNNTQIYARLHSQAQKQMYDEWM